MLLRAVLVSFSVLGFSQISYGQSRPAYYPAEHSLPPGARPPSYQEAFHAPAGGGTMNRSQMGYGMGTMGAETIGMGGPPGPEAMGMAGTSAGPGCYEGSCAPGTTNYIPWWHRWFVWSYWKSHGLPSPWNPPGNLTPHFPYTPCGSTYYYFRPYNWFHIPAQQSEAANYDGDPRNPYDSRAVFDGLYDGL